MGKVVKKCQVVDYCYCGEELHDYNMVDYFVHTYEMDLTSWERRAKEAATETFDDTIGGDDKNNESP